MSETDTTRRWFLRGGVAAGALTLAGCLGDDDDTTVDDDDEATDDTDDEVTDGDDADPATYEVWAADQGTNTIYIYEGTAGGDEFDLIDEIDTTAETDGAVPHMVHYSSDYEYAAVACTAGARTLVYRTEDKELVGDIETGAGSHFAGFTPADDAIIVDVIGESEIARIDADLETEEFTLDEVIEIDETVDGLTEQEGAPICHSYAHDGRSLHTLGPSYHDAGLVVVDHDDFNVDTGIPGDELPTNCGTVPHPTEEKFYLTAGLPTPTDEDGEPTGEDGVGEYFVLDTEGGSTDVLTQESTRGIDAHGFWFTTDGEELWVLNRETNDGVVVDPETDEVIDEIDAFGPDQSENPDERDAPDIMWASPDGQWMFVTLRGPAPLSGDPHAATGVTPGIAILDTESKDVVDVIEPDPIEEYAEDDIEAAIAEEDGAPAIPDFHAVGVRPVGEFDVDVGTPPYN